ncbi:NADP-dependent oxidoreductase [Aeromicrobium sp. P5_D10]
MNQTLAVVLASRPQGEPVHDNFRLETRSLPPLRAGQVLLKTIYLSLDPYMRGRMNDSRSYAKPVEIGDVMEGGTVCEVVDSASEHYASGDIVLARAGWQTHAVLDAEDLRRIDPVAAPISTALGVLGMPGFAAYAGMAEIGRVQPGETLVVAAASGAVGSVVGQIAKIKGARAVGIASGSEKVAWLDDLGFDVALDRRSPHFDQELAEAVPDGIDVYFENVGGAVWDAVFPHLNDFARVPVCGLISQYNQTSAPTGVDRLPALMSAINIKRLVVRGFTQRDLIASHYADFERDMPIWVSEGRMKYRETFVDGLENAPEAFFGLLHGTNFGKLIVRVAAERS